MGENWFEKKEKWVANKKHQRDCLDEEVGIDGDLDLEKEILSNFSYDDLINLWIFPNGN